MGRGNGPDGCWRWSGNPDLAVLQLPVSIFNIVQHSWHLHSVFLPRSHVLNSSMRLP